MKKELISVVVPVYNVQNYLKRCVDSIIEQTYSNLEIILVDDGSTDMSGKICDEYAEKDKRIVVIHQSNGGLSQARNSGMKIMTGKYVTFIDSDDYVSKDYVQYLFDMIKKYDADVSICLHRNFYENGHFDHERSKHVEIKIFDGESAVIDLCYQKSIPNSAWAKMYKTFLLKDIEYPVGRLYEDLGTTYKIFLKSKKIVFSSKEKYYYFQRANSIMHFKFSAKNMDRIWVAEELYRDVSCISPELKRAAISRMFISNVQVLRELPYQDMKYYAELQKIKMNIKKYRWSVLSDSNAKIINRIIALVSCVPLGVLQCFGSLYKMIYH